MSREAARLLCRSALPIARAGPRRFDVVQRRGFAGTDRLKVVKPYILADIGEGEYAGREPRPSVNVCRYHGMPGHPVVREAWGARRAIRSYMRSTIRQSVR